MHNYINRSDLLSLLLKGFDYPLTLAVAPAGSGKTIMLEQWKELIVDKDPSTTVISIDVNKRFNEDNYLFAQIFESVKGITQLWDEQFFNLFKDDSPVSTDTIITVLYQAFRQFEGKISLIFDDFHLIKSKAIQSQFSQLVSSLPKNVSIIVASRDYPDFSISKMKLNDSVFVLDINDFKLSENDIKALQGTIGSQELNANQVFELLRHTDGWFVGAKLAILAFDKGVADIDKIFNGDHSALIDYFGQEVIHRLSPNLRDFVLSTAICESFNRELCEEVFEVDYDAAKLEEFSMQVLFLRADTKRKGWYYYHPVVREFLLKILLDLKGQAHINDLHLKAAEFFLDRGEATLSIRHARQSNNRAFYIRKLNDICLEWFKKGDLEEIINVLEPIEEDQLSENVNLLVIKLFALCFNRYFNQAQYFLDLLKDVCSKKADNDLKSYVQFFERVLKVFQDESDASQIALVRTGDDQNIPAEVRAFHEVIDAYFLMCNGELKESFKKANQAKVKLQRVSHYFLESFATSIIILCDRYLGRGIEALQLMNKEFEPLRAGKRNQRWTNLATGMMVVDYEQNKLIQAQDLGEQLLPLVNHACATEVVATVYFYSSRIMHINGQAQKAARLLDQLERILGLGEYQRFNSLVVQEKMRQAFCSNLQNECDAIYGSYCLDLFLTNEAWVYEGHYEEWRERYALAVSYWLVQKGKYKQAYEVLDETARQLDIHGARSRALVARCNQVMISYKQGKNDSAVYTLKRLIDNYGLVCFSRSVFDEAPGLDSVFRELVSGDHVQLPPLFSEIFKSIIFKNGSHKRIDPKSILTDKELEIFELLSSGLTNDAISTQSGIALSTTKWHLKNIYSKLGVSNRLAAIHLALKVDGTEVE